MNIPYILLLFQSVTGEDVTQEELGGAKTHTATSGMEYTKSNIKIEYTVKSKICAFFFLANHHLYW